MKEINNDAKVSIISPCFNGEMYVSRMLESVVDQSYTNIEMLCVNDGSTDNTEKIIYSYVEKFKERGMALICISQKNAGQAAALNHGLKYVTGEYLAWIDCDDFFLPSAIEKKVAYLQEHKDCAIVTSDLFEIEQEKISEIQMMSCASYLFKNGNKKAKYIGILNYQKNQFYLTLIGKSIMECHTHLIRVEAFREINPMMEISRCRAGQNYQMLLPIYYYYNRGFINEPLSCYVIRKDSHFHSYRDFDQELERLNDLLFMLNETLLNMKLPKWEIQKYIRMSVFYRDRERLMENAGA